MQHFVRQFSTGSIEAPDPYDKHLDKIGYYRKHTARDSTCLFRVISEQMYNAQIHHEEIREICVNYMALKRSTYEELIVTDLEFDDYLTKMSKPRTFGTLAELHALAYRFKRNVLLFDPFSSGNWYVCETDFTECFLVFYTPLKHFDSVFPKSFIESVAFCQSITYEIIYSQVFKLPDVVYAVERMLHDPEEGTHVSRIEVSPYDDCQESLTLSDGRYFILDHADETECILENYLLCHFHNKQFEQITAQLHHDFFALHDNPDACVSLDQVFGALLTKKNVSCVRQLLDENITPFSYKVAKALDSHIYRNIEFDVWNDARKNTRFKHWPQGETLEVGIKCLVDNIDWNQKSSYSCHIQEMSPHKGTCLVFVETLGDYRTVPFSSLKTMPNVSWMIPSHQYRYREEKKKKQNSNAIQKMVEPCKNSKKKIFKINEEIMERNMDYLTRPLHIPQQYCEYIASPHVYSSRVPKNDDAGSLTSQSTNKNTANKKPFATSDLKSVKTEAQNVERESVTHFSTHTPSVHSDPQNQLVNSNNVPIHMGRGNMESNFSNQNYNKISSMVKRKELLPSLNLVNMDAAPSTDIGGSDIPYKEINTVRFFYNFGIEFLHYLRQHFPIKTIQSFLLHPYEQQAAQQRSRHQHYDNEMTELSNDFNRFTHIASKDSYSHKPNDGGNQHRRSFGGTPKKNQKPIRPLNKRPPDDTTWKYIQNFQKTDYSGQPRTQSSNNEGSSRNLVSDGMMVPPPHNMQHPPPQQFIPYHPDNFVDPANNMFLYGYPYPLISDGMVAYPMTVPGGIPMAEDEGDLAQTYPYINTQTYSHGTYYYPPYQINACHPLQMQPPPGQWYSQPVQAVPMTISTSTSSLGQYSAPGTSDNHSTNNNNVTSSVPYTPNEQLTYNENLFNLQKWSENEFQC